MSSSIAIPASRTSVPEAHNQPPKAATASSSSSSFSTSPMTPNRDKSESPASQKRKIVHQRRPSLLSTAIAKEEVAVVSIGDPDGPPRLISYQISGQGFMWNPEIFLPSYVDCDYVPLENRREPVHDIILSDEEIKNMFPQ